MIQRFEQFSSAIAAIYKYIQKIERDEMAKYGLKGPHVQCLMVMSRFPDGVTAAELCEFCEKDKAAISRAVAELEKSGMLLREREKERTYRAPLKLTDRGMETALRIRAIARQAVELAGKGLTDEDRSVLYAALNLIAANLQELSQEGIDMD